VSEGWEFHISEQVAQFMATLPPRTEARLLDIFAELREHQVALPGDRSQYDAKGRTQWVRLRHGFVIAFWIDPWEKEVRIVNVAFN